MGIESDQLVFDYLSRVGDLAQQRQLPSKERMSLVASLRDEIARQRTGGGSMGGGSMGGGGSGTADSPAAVRRILARLGTPDAVVAAVASGGLTLPGQRTARTPRFREDAATAARPAGAEPTGDPGPEPDWWSVVPGFTGGVEVPELLEPPKKAEAEEAEAEAAGKKPEEGAAKSASKSASTPAATARRLPRLLPRRRKAAGAEAAPAAGEEAEAAAAPRRFRNPMLLAAAGLLVAGTVLGSWLALAGGWLLAYASRRLSRAQAKWAVLGLPGLAVAGGVVWLWGRLDGRWGEPIPAGGEALGEALTGMWPWTVRAAALASALYLLWRARRT
ncbi:hypothetical protein [Streptomyces sp. TRM49041]|uniref:hypothetical protein n=1 Tax=Streptomyces sp. TRM49041 TaxID=2603216 RepID=UPI0011EDA125|nr:hypothetical protein [Streptomyces sp. TRM49041]